MNKQQIEAIKQELRDQEKAKIIIDQALAMRAYKLKEALKSKNSEVKK